MITAQERLREAARSAGWLAECEVRGTRWIADVLCTNGRSLVAFEDQLVDNRSLEDRTAKYYQSGVHVAWFTPKLKRRTISRLIGVVPIFDAADIEVVVPQLLAQFSEPRAYVAQDATRRCDLCSCPVSTISTFWCWSCWFRFTAPNSGHIARPYIHLTDWNRAREVLWNRWISVMKAKHEVMRAG